MDFLNLLISQWIQGSQGHAQHLKDWSRREQSSRHCVHRLAKNLGTDFCQQQVKAARVCCLPGRIHIQLFGDKQFKHNICVQQGGSRPAFQTAEEACRPAWYFWSKHPWKMESVQMCVCLDYIQCCWFSGASCCTAKPQMAAECVSGITKFFTWKCTRKKKLCRNSLYFDVLKIKSFYKVLNS